MRQRERTMRQQGEINLKKLLSALSPRLDDKPWVFAAVSESALPTYAMRALATFRESEAVTLVLASEDAEGLVVISNPMAKITLAVHSSLDAIGLTAAVSAALTKEGISANIVAAYYHDHVFVPFDRRDDAVDCLRSLAERKF